MWEHLPAQLWGQSAHSLLLLSPQGNCLDINSTSHGPAPQDLPGGPQVPVSPAQLLVFCQLPVSRRRPVAVWCVDRPWCPWYLVGHSERTGQSSLPDLSILLAISAHTLPCTNIQPSFVVSMFGVLVLTIFVISQLGS